MRYVIVDASGEIQRDLSVNSPELLRANLRKGEAAILTSPPVPNAWWNFETDCWSIPDPQPSPHHAWDPQAKYWRDTRQLEDIKAARWEAIKRRRDSEESGVFIWRGLKVDADKERVNGAVTRALIAQAMSLPYTDVWTLADNSTIPVTGPDVIDLGLTLAEHVSTCHAKARALRALINNATTIEQVEAINWS